MKTTIKIIGIVLFAFLLSLIPFNKNTIISVDFLTSSTIDLFGITLAIIALLFTVLDRYSEKVNDSKKEQLSSKSFPIIKNMGDDVVGTLLLIILLFLYDVLSIPIQNLQSFKFISFINLERFLMLLSLIFLLMITIDITISIISLINGLIKINKQNNLNNIEPTEQELQLISVTRKLDEKHFSELLDLINTIAVKQEIDQQNKK